MSIVEVNGLTKKFGDFTAVEAVSFNVNEGEIFGFLGPNGAGKSTTIAMLTTLLQPTAGEARVNGFSVIRDRDEVRRSIGIVFQDPSLDDRLTAEENLRFHARLYGVSGAEYRRRLEEVLRLVELWDRKDHIVRTFSGGMKRRLEIARGLIHYPKLLFLDEPTLGLDPQTRSHLWEYVLKLKRDQKMTIFMTTHYMQEAEYCDRIAVIDHGRIVALDTPAELKKQVGVDTVTVIAADHDALKLTLRDRYGLESRELGGAVEFGVVEGEKFLPKFLAEPGLKISSVALRKPTLDDVFLKLTGRVIRDQEAGAADKLRNHLHGRPAHH
ncbi:MAG: ATP-binding cassette domain-containing protein [Patescibacteria group bacterium]|jgi:ABC-2 type transport system ATP-binding protein